MKVAVLPNLDKRGSAEVVEKLGVILKNEGIDAYLPENICAGGFNHLPEEQLYKIADLIITIGGDGTIIRYAKRAALDNKPEEWAISRISSRTSWDFCQSLKQANILSKSV